MDLDALMPFGLALVSYLEGDTEATLTVRRDDGIESPIPVSHFFRAPSEFSAIENAALDRCRGSVLDIGAGTGLHALVLQAQDFSVTAIDIDPRADDVMRRRGVLDAHCADVHDFEAGPFGTLLMLGHGIGIVETLTGLDHFLARAHRLAGRDGQLLVHSMDVRQTSDPNNLVYHEANRRIGRYVGEIRIQFEFARHCGPHCGWLHVDQQTLAEHAVSAGWNCEIILEQDGGEYLALLTPTP
jgi:SAM-dependent methyltransferase